MSDDQFTKLFKYMEQRFDEMSSEHKALHKRIDEVYDSVDGLAGLIRDYHQELQMMSRQIDRMKQAIEQIAKETGVKLQIEL